MDSIALPPGDSVRLCGGRWIKQHFGLIQWPQSLASVLHLPQASPKLL